MLTPLFVVVEPDGEVEPVDRMTQMCRDHDVELGLVGDRCGWS